MVMMNLLIAYEEAFESILRFSMEAYLLRRSSMGLCYSRTHKGQRKNTPSFRKGKMAQEEKEPSA
jgi:hypothetical protein